MTVSINKSVQRVEVYGDKQVMVIYEITVDDPNDDLLPAASYQPVHLAKHIVTVDAEGNETTTPTDISGHDQLVQDICNAIWSD